MFNVNKDKVKNANLFMSGLALGTLGLKVLTSKDARKVYANVLAAGLRAKESLMQTAEKVQASGGDILAEAKEINESRSEELFAEEAETVEVEAKAAEKEKASDSKKEAKGDK